ncbi:hypothetical protein D9M69_654510 [compost metagenome]
MRGVLPAVEQIRLHGAFFAGKRIEATRLDAAVEHEREQHLEGFGLARAVGAAQDQSAVGEGEFLVAVIPEVDDAGPGRPETGAVHAFSTSGSSVLPENSELDSGAELSTAKSMRGSRSRTLTTTSR